MPAEVQPRASKPVDALAVAQLLDQIHRVIHADSFCEGLYPAQWSALRFLGQLSPNEASVTAFARYHQSRKATASQTMDALHRKGLIEKRPDEQDRRGTLLSLTAAGRELLRRDPLLLLGETIAALPAEEQWRVAETAESLLRGVLQRSAAAAATAETGRKG